MPGRPSCPNARLGMNLSAVGGLARKAPALHFLKALLHLRHIPIQNHVAAPLCCRTPTLVLSKPEFPATKNRVASNISVRMMGASQNFLRTRIKAQISLNVSIDLSRCTSVFFLRSLLEKIAEKRFKGVDRKQTAPKNGKKEGRLI